MERQTRKTLRLSGYDYGSYGYYFVTLCVKNKECLLGTVRDNAEQGAIVCLPPLGEEVKKSWLRIEGLNRNVRLDIFVIMPNHIHGIIILENDDLLTTGPRPSGFGVQESSDRRALPGLIKDFRSVTTRVYQRKYGRRRFMMRSSALKRNMMAFGSILQTIPASGMMIGIMDRLWGVSRKNKIGPSRTNFVAARRGRRALPVPSAPCEFAPTHP